MAQYQIPNPEDMLDCPYCSVEIRAIGFQHHLIKCKKNYNGKDFVSCPFNATHLMPKAELRQHSVNCPDKAMMEPEIRYTASKKNGTNNKFKGCTDTPVYHDPAIPMNEDWDSETPGNGVVGSHHDGPTFYRVQFHDNTWAEKSVLTDKTSQHVEEDEDILRLPKTASMAAMPRQPQPKQQPTSSVFAYSIGRGRGLPQQPQTNGHTETFSPFMPYGRGVAPPSGAMGVGRGMAPGGLGRGSGVAPPPGFYVPKVSKD